MRRRATTILIAAFVGAPVSLKPLQAQTSPGIAGHWTLSRELSQLPSDVGFDADFAPGGAADAASAGGRGRGRARGPASPFSRPESEDDAKRTRELTAEARAPSVNLTILDAAAAVTVTDDHGRTRTFRPTGKEETVQLDDVPVGVVAARTAGHLVVTYRVADGRDLRYTYSRGSSSEQLVVEVAFIEQGTVGSSLRRVYLPGTAPLSPNSPSATSTRAAAPEPADRAPSAAPAQSPDSELKGLTRLGVIVEGLGSPAAACGLSQSTIEAAVAKSLTDVGLTVLHNLSSDENTYLYVNIVTSSVSAGLCVSRYDAFLYTHTTARLSYHDAPVPVQVLLLHDGGMAGGSAASHPDAVLRGVKAYVDQIAAQIRDANAASEPKPNR